MRPSSIIPVVASFTIITTLTSLFCEFSSSRVVVVEGIHLRSSNNNRPSLGDVVEESNNDWLENAREIVKDALMQRTDAAVVRDIGNDDDGIIRNDDDDNGHSHHHNPSDKSKQAIWDDMTRTLVAELGNYPSGTHNIGNSTNNIPNGQVTMSFNPDDEQNGDDGSTFKFRYRLMGMTRQCQNCKVGIHLGKTCDVASAIGGSFWNSDTMRNNPWDAKNSPAVYNASSYTTKDRKERSSTTTGNFDMNIGYGFDDIKGHAIVFMDSNGNGVRCGTLQSLLSITIQREIILASKILPDTRREEASGRRHGTGEVGLFYKLDGSFVLKYNMDHLPTNCRNCKVQILLGTLCDETNLQGTQYWNSNKLLVNPWTIRGNSAVYTTSKIGNTTGELKFYNGFDQMDTRGHVIVFRDERDDVVACGTLELTLAYLMKSIFD